MKTLFIFLILLAICAFLFFFAPHHIREENSFRPCTLYEIYADFFKDMSDLTTSRLGFILLLGLAGLATAFYPALLALLVRYAPNASGWLVAAGIIALIGAGVNFLAMLLSHTSFSFGGASSSGTETFYLGLIVVFQLVFAVTGIVLGAVPKWANVLQNWLAA